MNNHSTGMIPYSLFHAPISEEIWKKKYRFVAEDGIQDQDVFDTWKRIAIDLASCERDNHAWEKEFYEALKDWKFLPAGRITAGAGTGRRVTLSNCFTMGTIPDSMEGIFESLKEAALTMQQGGGIGYDFSTLRPKGSLVKGVESDASGPLSFMDCWDAMCRTIMSAGSRRGAMMATMRCDHPDIEDFITAKQDAARLRMFNMSVLVTDGFMHAVKNDLRWELIWNDAVIKEIPARELWDKIMKGTYAYAEPGVIFIDRVNQDHNLRYLETIATTNPCGEKPMGPYASCLLGSVNLAALVEKPFTPQAKIDEDVLIHLVMTAVRMMDNVIEVGGFPLPAQAKKAQQDRQLGLGITGLANALAMCGLRYGSEEAAQQASEWMRLINQHAYLASVKLAEEKGPFPTFDAVEILKEGTHASRLPEALKKLIEKHGLRNSLLTSIAPTGTISLYAGNVSSGIEPIFATSYTRKVLEKDGSRSEQVVEDFAFAKWRKLKGDKPLPDYVVTTADLAPEDHIRMQAAIQKHVDSSISKTVNLPEDISFEAFKEVYMLAYDSGCKGCTTYRPNDITGSVLSVEPKQEPKEELVAEDPDSTMKDMEAKFIALQADVALRPQELPGSTYKIKWPDSDHAIYITINDILEGEHRRPFEIFINSKNMEHFAWTVALTRMISAVFRRGGPVGFVVEELKAVFDPRGGAWVGGKYIPSVLAAIGGVIEQHMRAIGYLDRKMSIGVDTGTPDGDLPMGVVVEADQKGTMKMTGLVELCSRCSSATVVYEAGCKVCKSCGHSACG